MSNIIRAIFNNVNDKEVFAKARYQYDYGMVLRFEGAVTLPSAYEVHFALARHGEAITQIGNSEGVPVPDALFLAGKTIYAWAYLHSGEDDGYTEYMVQIPVIKRAQPSDEVPTPVQQSAIDQAIAALGVAVEQTAADVETTTEKAAEAQASAEAAAASAAEAAETAENVEENVTAARAAKAAAEAARDRAVQAETSAGQSKTAAATSETNAAASASAAATSATNAAASAKSVASSAAQITQNAEDIDALKEELTLDSSELFAEVSEVGATTTLSEWKLNDSGYRVSDAGYKITTHRVFAGDVIKVVSDHKFQFQNTTTVTASGTLYRIGNTYGTGTYYLTVPAGVTYVVLSTPSTSNAHVYVCESVIDALAADITYLQDTAKETNEITGCKPFEYASGYIEATNPITFVDGHPYQNPGSTAFKSAYAACKAGDKFTVSGNNNTSTIRVWMFVDTNGAILTAAASDTDIDDDVVTAPANAAWICINTKNLNDVSYIGAFVSQQIKDAVNDAAGVTKANLSAIYNAYTSDISDIPCPETVASARVAIDLNSSKFVSGTGYIVYVPIVALTKIRVIKPQTPTCIVCFTSTVPAADASITHYNVFTGYENTNVVVESQSGDNYVVVYSSSAIATDDVSFYYSQTARGTVNLLPQLDPHMINLLKYRPVGKVSKAYIALSCDDGHNSLATYTLPRIQYWNNYYNTNIPLHMALFDNSPVFANTDYTALVTDMCENHNCSIGIHGTQPYENYPSSTSLYAYLNKQWNTIIDKTGITPTSVIYPHSSYNDQIMVMAAGFCGICGASGTDASPYTYKDDQDGYWYVGEKSNCYEIYRLSIKDTRIGNATEAQRIIDYAIAHNLIICPYFHDDDFTEYSEATNNFNRAMLDAFIQYGMEQGVEFINFGDIPKML